MPEVKRIITEPLKGKELHYHHINPEIAYNLNSIKECIQNDIFGCHLIGGIRGTGKTSFVNLCMKILDSQKYKELRIQMSLLGNIDNLFNELVKQLYILSDNQVLDDKLNKDIKELYLRVFLNKNKELNIFDVLQNINSDINTESSDSILSVHSEVPIIKLGKKYTKAKTLTESNITDSLIKHHIRFKESTDFYTLFSTLENIISRLINMGIRIVMIFDELDKCPLKTVESIFRLYKTLLLDSRITSIFIVGFDDFIHYSSEDIWENPLNSYFITKSYISTLDLEDTKTYLTQFFGIRDAWNVNKIFYETNGILRKINYRKYSNCKNTYIDYIGLKAYLFVEVLEHIKFNNITTIEKDCMKILIKQCINHIIDIEKISYNSLILFVKDNYRLKNLNELRIISIINSLVNTAIKIGVLLEINTDKDNIKWIKTKYDNDLLFDTRRVLEQKEYENELIEFAKSKPYSEVNYCFTKCPEHKICIATGIDGFHIARQFIESSYYDLKNLIIIEKKFPFMGYDGYSYSAVLIIRKPMGLVNYYVEDCSWSYEYSNRYYDFKEFLKEINIKPIVLEYEEICIGDNMSSIHDDIDKKMYG